MCEFVLCWELFLHKRLHTMRYWWKDDNLIFNVFLSYVENYFSPKGCTQWDIGENTLIFDVCVCPMLRIISPQKAAHNEILVKRQQFNFQCVFVLCWELFLPKRLHTMRYWWKYVNFRCVCLSYVENYFSTKGFTQWVIGKKTTI